MANQRAGEDSGDNNGGSQQSLSALVDGELEGSEARFLLRRLEHDPQLAEQWERYHLARDVMRGSRPVPDAAGLNEFSRQISAAVASEAPPQVAVGSDVRVDTSAPARRRWLQPLAGAAVAAGVAVAAIGAFQPPGSELDGTAPQTLLSTQSGVAGGLNQETPVAGDAGRTAVEPGADVDWQNAGRDSAIGQPVAAGAAGRNPVLQRYLIRHSQVSAQGHRMPLVYVVTDPSNPAQEPDLDDDGSLETGGAQNQSASPVPTP